MMNTSARDHTGNISSNHSHGHDLHDQPVNSKELQDPAGGKVFYELQLQSEYTNTRLGPVLGVAKSSDGQKNLFEFCLIFSLLTRAIAWDSSVGCHFCG